jgi:predicted nucleic acid-binding protein
MSRGKPGALQANDPGLKLPAAPAFVDTNVLLYLLSSDVTRADRAESLLSAGAIVSVQVLNEFTAVARRKLALDWVEIDEVLGVVRALCAVRPLAVETHDFGVRLARRYMLAVYDAMIVASALEAGCDTLYTEDLQDGLLIEGVLRVRNPFAA